MVEWEQKFFDRRRRGRSSTADGKPSPAAEQGAAKAPRGDADSADYGGSERRQFADSHADLSPEAREFAQAVDRYKLQRGKKFITLGEIFEVMRGLGYKK